MKKAILDFPSQFSFSPKVIYPSKRAFPKRYVLCGMGGSALPGDLLRAWDPTLDVFVHRDYNLPLSLPKSELIKRLIIVSSYSGTTEEALSAFHAARKARCRVATISTGGTLKTLSQKYKVPHIIMPRTGIQPRMGTGLIMKSILALMGKRHALREISSLAATLHPLAYETHGEKLARFFRGKIPLIYASRRNGPLAYLWKIKLNETGKTPAFSNVVPELNHNEMTSFDPMPAEYGVSVRRERKKLQKNFAAMLLQDENDSPEYRSRLAILPRLYRNRGVDTIAIKVPKRKHNLFFGIFASSLLADWTAYHLADSYGLEPEEVPMVEEFKRLVSR